MANINNIKIGDKNLDSIMFSDIHIDPTYYKFNFNEWVNTDNAVMEITNDKVIITKFKPNVWLLHSPNPLKGTNCDEVCNFCRGTRINVTGLANHTSLFDSYYETWTTTGAWGDRGKLRGLCFYPFSTDGQFLTVHLNYWEHVGIDSEGNETLPQLPDMVFEGGLRLDGNSRNTYGLFQGDKKNKLIFPDELYGFNNTQDYSYYYAFGLFTNNLSSVNEDGYIDITNNPITIELINSKGIDVTTKECWDVYFRDAKQYHKDKTFENCWKKYGFVTDKYTDEEGEEHPYLYGRYSVLNQTGYNFDGGISIPKIIDLTDVIKVKGDDNIVKSYLTWNISVTNDDFWTDVRNWYNSNTINSTMIINGLFTDSNINGDITLNINNDENLIDSGNTNIANYYLVANDFVKNSKLNSITFNLADGHRFSVGQNMFRLATELTECHTNVSIAARDCSGMFEFCGKLKTYDSNLINWSDRGNFQEINEGSTNVQFAFEYTGLETIPSFNEENRFDNTNTIVCSPYSVQVFNGSKSLKNVGPIIDVKYVNPSRDGYARNMFEASSITDIRIKNLNHNDWYLNGKGSGNNYHGNLPNLDQESINYLIENLYDLANNYNSDNVIKYNNSFINWLGIVKSDTNANVKLDNIGWKSASICEFGKRFSTGELAVSPCHTTAQFTNLKINVSGLVAGDRLEFGSGIINSSEKSMTTDGEYTINKTNDSDEGFVLYRDGEPLTLSEYQNVIITIIDAFDYQIPSVNSATLHCPLTWNGKISTELTQSANNKGWNIVYE